MPWFMHPGVWATYILIVFFSELLVSDSSPSMARTILNLAQILILISLVRHLSWIYIDKGKIRMRFNLGYALLVMVVCIGIGASMLWWLEGLTVIECVYGSVMSLCTIRYGGITFKTRIGKLFSVIWVLASKVLVASVFHYLAELRKYEIHQAIVKRLVGREITLEDFRAIDTNRCGSIRKSEYVTYKVKEMLEEVNRIGEEDMSMISKQFSKLDPNNTGMVTYDISEKGL